MVERLYAVQGPENSGWVTTETLRSAAGYAGVDADRMLADGGSATVAEAMLDAARHADAAHVRGTPSFELGPTGRPLKPFAAASLNPDSFRPALDRLLSA